jgi:8-hydroxy-5-deazaflavin:NADPH oxidoreductase
MQIAVIGSGDMGGALALALSRRHRVSVSGSRLGSESAAAVVAESGGRVTEAEASAAASAADVVILAVPWTAVSQTLGAELIRALDEKILIVVTLPWVDTETLAVGTTTSGAEAIAATVRGARVVQAFNTVASATVAAPAEHGIPATTIVSSDDAGAKATVMQLARELGLDVVDGGPLRTARYTEPMAMLYAQLAYDGQLGETVAFRVLRDNAPLNAPLNAA